MEEKLLKDIKKRLEVIVNLIMRQIAQNSDEFSFRSQIKLLSSFGLKPKEISEILGKPNTYVNKELTWLRKVKK